MEDELELPEWMKPIMVKKVNENLSKNKISSTAKIEVSQSQSKTEKDSVVRCNTFYEIAEWCEKLLNKANSSSLTLGLDLDWPSAYKSVFKTKQIHICCGENECAILNVFDVEIIPRSLALLLKHSNVTWLGFNICKDIAKLGKDFSLEVNEILSKIGNPEDFAEVKLSCRHHWSVKSVIEKGSGETEGVSKILGIQKLQFKGLINYTRTINDCGAVCEKLLKIANFFPKDSKLVFGFDVEWPFTYKAGPGGGKVALIQMCPEDRVCFLFHVAFFKSLPKTLVLLLKHPRVKLTGLNIANDIRKIGKDFRIDVTDILGNNLIELCSLANKKLNVSQRWSLDGLVLNQLNLILEKPKDVRISNWAAERLKKEQVSYAASDAYASLAVYNHLKKILFFIINTMTISVITMRMGLMGYMKALGLQNNLAELIKVKQFPFSGGALLLMEHLPVYTVGLRRKDYGPEYEQQLKKLGAEFVYTNRGGLVTFHGPGQLIAYPILNLKMFKASMRWYVESLEEVVIRLCSEYSLGCGRSPHTGVWIGNNKLCAIGVHGSKFVTTHGLALNCSTDMSWFEHIVPCGIEDKGVTSLSRELNCNITPDDVIPRFLKCFQDHFSCELLEDEGKNYQQLIV